jgi:hypothetical protein
MLNPVGPQSPGVYWLRRALVLLVLLLVVLGVVGLLGGRGGDPAPTAAPVAPSPSPSPSSSSPAASSSADPTSSASPDKTKTKTPACKDSAVAVTASTDAASYQVGSTPRLRMQITNKSSSACKRDIGADANELIINLGETKFWSSDDCSPGGKSDVVTLEADQSYSVSLTWLGRASAPDCPADQPAAKAGSYNLVGRNGDVLSKPEPFSLT